MSNVTVLSNEKGEFELNKSMKERMVVLSDGKILINENYKNDLDVLSKKAFYLNIETEVGDKFTKEENISYVDGATIHKYYNADERLMFRDNASIVQGKVTNLITIAFSKKATDIHVVLEAPSTYIYFRILGDLRLYQTLSFEDGNEMCAAIYASMTATAGTNFNPLEQQDANMSANYLPHGLSGVRIATGPTQSANYFMVMRLLPESNETKLEDLGYSRSQLESLYRCFSTYNGGITLLSGPTGSGKSTTLKAAMENILLKTEGRINCITIEDPVEYKIQAHTTIIEEVEEYINNKPTMIKKEKTITYSARQIAIKSADSIENKRKMFQKALTAVLRQDPDFIMIGEIRDDVTATAATVASETGHPVLTTVHAQNASSIIERLINIGAKKSLLLSPSMINGMVAQQLIPVLCPKCKIPLAENKTLIDESLLNRLESVFKEYDGLDGIYIKGNDITINGCGYYDKEKSLSCIDGYITREVIAEIIIPDVQYLQYIREDNPVEAQYYWINQLDGYTMMAHGLAKVKKGMVDPRKLESTLREITMQHNLKKAISDV